MPIRRLVVQDGGRMQRAANPGRPGMKATRQTRR